MVIDPICKMKVEELKNCSMVSRYLGKLYYFCSLDCKKKFDLNPTRYLDIVSTEQTGENKNTLTLNYQSLKQDIDGSTPQLFFNKDKIDKKTQRTLIPIRGMTCSSCANTIEKTLKSTPGVQNICVSLANDAAVVDYDSSLTSRERLYKVVEDIGYGINLKKITVSIDGMKCISCAVGIDKALTNTEGIISTQINFINGKGLIEFDPSKIEIKGIYNIIEDIGYKIKITDNKKKSSLDIQRSTTIAKLKFFFAWLFTLPIIVMMIMEIFSLVEIPRYHLLIFFLSVPVVFIIGFSIHHNAIKAALNKIVTMDTLLSLGTVASFFTGFFSFSLQVESYTGIAAMIIAFHLTGKYLESRSRSKSSLSIKKLIAFEAKKATIQVDNKKEEVSIENLIIGDIILIRPGDKIPADGTVIEGESRVNESMVTGESTFVKRRIGDQVIEATINQGGFLKVRVDKVGRDTFLYKIIRMIEECQTSKVPIQALADRIIAYFVPTILAISMITLFFWLFFPRPTYNIIPTTFLSLIPWLKTNLNPLPQAIFASMAVLIIACPCAIGLATPIVLMVGTGIAASKGILIKNGAAIQKLKDVNIIIFDKTGTLTTGNPDISDILPQQGFKEEDILYFAGSLEVLSSHPIATAIKNKMKQSGVTPNKVEDFISISGKGIKGKVSGKEVLVGSLDLMNEYHIIYTHLENKISELRKEAKTIIGIAIDNILVGIIAIGDVLKDNALHTINKIKEAGIIPTILSGDNKETVFALGRKLGINHIVPEVLPDKKVTEIKRIQSSGKIVAMVGDGINDAPALTQADIGIALGTGTAIAIESADLILLRDDISKVYEAVVLSKVIFRKIKQNLFWAFFYNIIAIPIAIMGLLHPIIAELAMGFSSINIIGNALLLKKQVKLQEKFEKTEI
ncbi:MAG: heavy metal translocating P-type ATPase [bacterium]